MSELTLGLVQMKCQKGAIEYNIISMYKYLEECRKIGVDIVCFPEMNITGRINPLKYSNAILYMYSPSIQRVADMSFLYQTIIIAGFVEKNYTGKPYITQFVAKDGKIAYYYRKRILGSDESELFSPGSEATVFSYSGCKFGLMICHDIDDERIFKEYAEKGTNLIFECAALGLPIGKSSKERGSHFQWWRNECKSKLSKHAKEYGMYIAAATQTGRISDEEFPGGGYVFAPGGKCIYETKDFSEGMLVAKIEITKVNQNIS